MQIIDLFSGIGGFSLAGSWMGWKTIQFCENNNFCKQILTKHWPGIPIQDDIKTLTVQQIINNGLYDPKEKTILTAGVPCQPWSNAGKRQGEADIRNLWPETIRFTELFRPDFTLFENVPGLLTWNKGFFFENICASLENAGYEIWPFIIPSASIGAWDKRERVWIIAYNHSFRCSNEQKENGQSLQNGIRIDKAQEQKRGEQQCRLMQSDSIITNDNSKGLQKSRLKSRKQTVYERVGIEYCDCIASDTISSGRENGLHGGESERETGKCRNGFKKPDWWERNWIEVASELCGSNARVSNRMDRIKALGNSVNPYVVYELFKAIDQFAIE